PSVGLRSGEDRGGFVAHQVLYYVTRDRGGDLSTAPTFVQHDDHDVLRIREGRDPDEPGVVVAVPCGLSGPGLATDLFDAFSEVREGDPGRSRRDDPAEIG